MYITEKLICHGLMLDGQLMLCLNAANSNPSTWAKLMTTTASLNTVYYVSWQCVSVKDKLCDNIKQKWEDLRGAVKEASNVTVTVPFVHFKKMSYKKKNGFIVDRLETVKEEANINFITDFINKILPKTIHHQNYLKHFRAVHHQFISFFDCGYMDVDFSENLFVPVGK